MSLRTILFIRSARVCLRLRMLYIYQLLLKKLVDVVGIVVSVNGEIIRIDDIYLIVRSNLHV